jgi:hypothetical protein
VRHELPKSALHHGERRIAGYRRHANDSLWSRAREEQQRKAVVRVDSPAGAASGVRIDP